MCRDSTECADAYTNTGYCGFIPGGSKSVCTCIYDYYGVTGGSCQAAKKVGIAGNICTTALSQPECEYNSYCNGAPGVCTCGSISYQNSNGSCLYKGYRGDPCTSNSACWSGTCQGSNLCS